MATRKKKTANGLRAVVVTDTHRGICFGYLRETKHDGKTVVLEGMRHCFYYAVHTGHQGINGLATGGPAKGSQIGPRCTATINDVAKVIECTPEAIARWEAAGWGT